MRRIDFINNNGIYDILIDNIKVGTFNVNKENDNAIINQNVDDNHSKGLFGIILLSEILSYVLLEDNTINVAKTYSDDDIIINNDYKLLGIDVQIDNDRVCYSKKR